MLEIDGPINDPISDMELERLALAADPDPEIDDGVAPFGSTDGDGGLLPAWYMPVARRVDRRPARVLVVALIVGALVLVNGVGLCVTYGWPEIAW